MMYPFTVSSCLEGFYRLIFWLVFAAGFRIQFVYYITEHLRVRHSIYNWRQCSHWWEYKLIAWGWGCRVCGVSDFVVCVCDSTNRCGVLVLKNRCAWLWWSRHGFSANCFYGVSHLLGGKWLVWIDAEGKNLEELCRCAFSFLSFSPSCPLSLFLCMTFWCLGVCMVAFSSSFIYSSCSHVRTCSDGTLDIWSFPRPIRPFFPSTCIIIMCELKYQGE